MREGENVGEEESGGGRGGGRMKTRVAVRVHALEFSVCTELREAHVASHRGRRALGVRAGGWPHHRQPVPALSSMGYTSLGP